MVNSRIDDYVQEICSYVKFKKAHKEISTEIVNHIEEKTEDLMLEGIEESEASQKALSEMGDAEIIGKQLNESHKAAPEWSILLMTILFSVIGLVIAYLMVASGVASYNFIFQKSGIFSILGYAVIIGLCFFDYKKLEKYSGKIFIGTTIILFIQLVITPPINGVKAWLPIGSLSIDITELTLFLYIVSISKLIKDVKLKQMKDFVYLTLILVVPVFLYFQLRVGMETMAYFILFIIFMVKSKVKLSYILSVIGTFLAGCCYVVFSEPYRIKRLLIFLNPKSDPNGAGYIGFQIQKILSSVGLRGNGFNFPKRLIPGLESNFILTYIIYTFGWIAGIALIALVIAFIIRMFTAAREVKDTYGRFIIQGFMCIFAIEFIWNILMILGFVPIISVSLPFISYGHSRLITQMAAIGIIMSIYRSKSLSYA